ncbi:type VI secretion system baseplate subunit TssG [Rugamonas sp.]|uniref:type VI secretion system baseplate subunit TssG n=1 Tax=Rugamonas sp. TaxID=1926287 RepID=UPI0025D71E5D|nr:type VI secretion system baseplate subunit TssG [Rugamonas sp.]
MQAKKRLPEVSVIQGLIDGPERFQFVQAVRILLRWLAQNGVPQEHALAHVLRFRNSLSLNFPASEIEALATWPSACVTDTDLMRALRESPGTQIALTPTFLGLLGVNGTLPLHKTGRVAMAEQWDGDTSARAFIDLFSHRMVGMFFQAWGKYRLEHQFDLGGKDGQWQLLTALVGVHGGAGPAAGRRLSDHVAAYYAALLRTRPVSASTVSRVLTDHFGVPIELEPFVEAWDHIPDNKRSKLGGKVSRLGHGATLGGRLRRWDIRTRLNIGPVDKADFERFLPRSVAAVALAEMVSLFGLPNLEFEVRLILKPSCLKPLTLTNAPGAARRLGWDAFLPRQDGTVSRNPVGYLLPLAAGLNDPGN